MTVTGAWTQDFDVRPGDEWNATTKTLTVNSDFEDYAYEQIDAIEHVIIADGVTTIGEGAF